MKRHEQKIRAISKRNRKIFAVTTMVGLVCPATLGTVQALADETVPQTEQQTSNPVTEQTTETQQTTTEIPIQELVTPTQPQTETQTQEPVTPEPAPTETAPVQAQQTATEAPAVEESEKAESEISIQDNSSELLAQWEEMVGYMNQITPVLEEIESKVAGTAFQAKYDELNGVMSIIQNIGGDMPPEQREQAFYDYWIPELQRVLSEANQLRDEVNQTPTLESKIEQFKKLQVEAGALLDEVKALAEDTPFYERYQELYGEYDMVSFTFPSWQGTLEGYYDWGIGQYNSVIQALNVLKDEITSTNPSMYNTISDLLDSVKDKIVGNTEWEDEHWSLWAENEVIYESVYLHPDDYAEWSAEQYANLLPRVQAFVDKVNSGQPAETVNYTIRCVDVNGIKTFPDITKSAKKDASITENAPKIEGYFVLHGNDTITQTIGDNTVFTFEYSNQPKVTNIHLELVGNTTAKIGESKTYQLLEEIYWNDQSKNTSKMLDFPTSYGKLISSDPSDVISNGAIVFGKAGTRTLSVEDLGVTLVVTVTDGTTPPKPEEVDDSKLKEAIKNGEDKINQGGWENTKDLESAISKGKEVLGNKDRTQSQIDEATKAITDASNALKKANGKGDGSQNGNNGNDGSNNSNNGSGNNAGGQNTDSDKDDNYNNGSNSKTVVNNVSNKNNQANSSDKDNLPKAGENASSTALLLAGLTLTGFSTIGILKRRRKA